MQGEKYMLDDQRVLLKIDSKEIGKVQPRQSIDADPPTEIMDHQSESCYLDSPLQQQKWRQPFFSDSSLEVNTISEPEIKSKARGSIQHAQLLRKSRYRKRILDPLANQPKLKMSNNIKDYLSVEKIPIKEIQESLVSHKIKLQKQYNHSNLLGFGSNPQAEGK